MGFALWLRISELAILPVDPFALDIPQLWDTLILLRKFLNKGVSETNVTI
jgi:hypothetical protein